MKYLQLAHQIIEANVQITPTQAESLITCPDNDVFALASAAHAIKQHYYSNKIKLCSLINAKSGKCSENCSFCAQSAHFKTPADSYSMVAEAQIIEQATTARDRHATCFSIVTSGKGITDARDMSTLCSSLEGISQNLGLKSCASLGIMSAEQLTALKNAGLKRFHHNLETAESFFSSICTTHTYEERIQTIRDAKAIGLEVCSGGIFGLGETPQQRLELAFTLKGLEVDSIPINILNPIPGTAAEHAPSLSPLETLRLVATYRFIFPNKDVGVLGGREARLGDLQALILISGANVILIGNYLTTSGRDAEADLDMIRALGMQIN